MLICYYGDNCAYRITIVDVIQPSCLIPISMRTLEILTGMLPVAVDGGCVCEMCVCMRALRSTNCYNYQCCIDRSDIY